MSVVQPFVSRTPAPYTERDFGRLAKLQGISQAAIELHLEIYRAYVANVNRLLADCESDMRRFTYEYNGMILHEQFFEQLSPESVELPPRGKFVKALEQCFASVEAWKQDLRERARTRGIGWVICTRDDASNRIFNTWIDLHHLGLPARTTPALVIDLWEHAWLSDYRPSAREDYVEAVLGQTDWKIVERRCWTPRN